MVGKNQGVRGCADGQGRRVGSAAPHLRVRGHAPSFSTPDPSTTATPFPPPATPTVQWYGFTPYPVVEHGRQKARGFRGCTRQGFFPTLCSRLSVPSSQLGGNRQNFSWGMRPCGHHAWGMSYDFTLASCLSAPATAKGPGRSPSRPQISCPPLPRGAEARMTSYCLVRIDTSCAVKWGGSQSTGGRIPAHSPSRGMCNEITTCAEADCAGAAPEARG